MRWEDERYVRLYTRDSATWALLPWQGRCLLPLLLRKVDRAGVLEVLEGEEVAALAELVKVPEEVVGPGLEALQKRGTVVIRAGKLQLPTFLAAQEARASDKIRQQKSRELAAIAEGVSHGVTRGHTRSHGVTDVTPSLAVPSLAVEETLSSRLDEPPPVSFGVVFEHWKRVMARPDAKPIDKRRRAVAGRIHEGYTVEQLKTAVDGCARTPHNMGQNDQHKRFDDLELICRSGSQVERFIRNAGGPQIAPAAASKFLNAEERKNLYPDGAA